MGENDLDLFVLWLFIALLKFLNVQYFIRLLKASLMYLCIEIQKLYLWSLALMRPGQNSGPRWS